MFACSWFEWYFRVNIVSRRGRHLRLRRQIPRFGDFALEGFEGDAVGAHDVAGGAGLELAGGVAELVEDFLDQLGGAGAAGADLLDEGLELAVGGDDFIDLAGGVGEGGLELGGTWVGHGREAGGGGGGIASDELAGEGAAVFATGDERDLAAVGELVVVEGGDAVFFPEGAAGEGDDVIADVGVEVVLGELGLAGFLGDAACEDGALGEEAGVTGNGDAVFLAVADEAGDVGDELGGEVAAALGGVAGGGFEGGGEDVALSGIGAGWAYAWHGGGVGLGVLRGSSNGSGMEFPWAAFRMNQWVAGRSDSGKGETAAGARKMEFFKGDGGREPRMDGHERESGFGK